MTGAGKLPARVEAEIARQQYQSELVVGFGQIAVLAFLAMLYLAAPAGYAPDAPLKAAPLGLSVFTVLVCLRLYFALTGQLSSWLIGAATIAESVILAATLAAYHIQFEQPATIALKNTAFLYFFVIIALRSLRFDLRWVVLSGAAAALSWGALVFFALETAPQNPLTWDFVTYATSGRIHPGGEFDKIFTLLTVTAVLGFSLYRARRLLVQAAAQTQAAADLSLFFDADVAKTITGKEAENMAGQGQLRHAAILFTDMRGFTVAAANLTPDALIDLLREYQGVVVPIIRQFGGSIDKFMGDGILASFGAVNPSETFAADGFRAVDAIMAASTAWQDKRRKEGLAAPGIGAGLAVGEVVFGIIGHDRRLEYTVIGDAVNLAAKLEKHNKAEKVRALSTTSALDLAVAQGCADAGREKRLQRVVAGTDKPLDLVVWP